MIPLFVVIYGLSGQPQGEGASAKPHLPVVRELPPSYRPDWMTKDKELTENSIAITMRGQPLKVVLQKIREQTKVELRVSRALADYRISLSLPQPVPLGQWMGRLQDLFLHGNTDKKWVRWERETAEGVTPRYTLMQTLEGDREEQDGLDLYRRTVRRWFREVRQYANLPEEKRKDFKTDFTFLKQCVQKSLSLEQSDTGYVLEPMAALTEDQIETLLDNGLVNAPQYTPSDALVQLLRRRDQEDLYLGQKPSDAPPGQVQMFIQRGILNEEPFLGVHYQKGYNPIKKMMLPLDPHNTDLYEDVEADVQEASKRENAPEVNLFAHLDVPVGATPQMSLASALDLFAKETKRPVYAEIFFTRKQWIQYPKGKPEYLLTRLCRTFSCEWRKINGDYIVWRKPWAEDRRANIAQEDITRWDQQLKKTGFFPLKDLLDMARLSVYKQETLFTVYGEASRMHSAYIESLQFVATLPEEVLQAARQEEGTTLRELSEAQQALLQKVYADKPVVLPVTLRTKPEGDVGWLMFYFTDARGTQARGGIRNGKETAAAYAPK